MKIVIENGSGVFEEKKSRFIANVYHIESDEQAVEVISRVKKRFWDARHNCYAYVCGKNGGIQHFSDDGEPQGTAGKPILEIINTNQMKDCLIVVTRYFGGVLLGTGGLIRAYQTAAKEGLAGSRIAEVTEGMSAVMHVDYNVYGKLQYMCNEFGIHILKSEFGENVYLELLLPKDRCEAFSKRLSDAFAGKTRLEDMTGQDFCLCDDGSVFLCR